MHLVGFITRKFVTMHGHVNAKYPTYLLSRTTNAKHIYINNTLHTVSTATCFDASASSSGSLILLLC
jgi:hypothetical protein